MAQLLCMLTINRSFMIAKNCLLHYLCMIFLLKPVLLLHFVWFCITHVWIISQIRKTYVSASPWRFYLYYLSIQNQLSCIEHFEVFILQHRASSTLECLLTIWAYFFFKVWGFACAATPQLAASCLYFESILNDPLTGYVVGSTSLFQSFRITSSWLFHVGLALCFLLTYSFFFRFSFVY